MREMWLHNVTWTYCLTQVSRQYLVTGGTKFIVEKQKRMQPNFFRRCISYAAKVYDTGTVKRDKDRYDIAPVYVIAILNGQLDHKEEREWSTECISRYSFIEHRTKEFAQETISACYLC